MNKAAILDKVYKSNLPSRAVLVIMYLINRTNKELTCFPAIPTIAKETNISERTVQRAIKDIVEAGFIAKSPRYRSNGGQSSNLYSLNIVTNCDSEKPIHKEKQDSIVIKEKEMEAFTESIQDNIKELEMIDFSIFYTDDTSEKVDEESCEVSDTTKKSDIEVCAIEFAKNILGENNMTDVPEIAENKIIRNEIGKTIDLNKSCDSSYHIYEFLSREKRLSENATVGLYYPFTTYKSLYKQRCQGDGDSFVPP